MKSTKTSLKAVFLAFVLILLLIPNARAQEDWRAPDSTNQLINPLKDNQSAADQGKKTYKMLCVICHGTKGKGDGMGAAGLSPKPTDLTIGKIQEQTDGALFWKLSEGRPPMAAYKSVLPETQRWEVINYIRTLKQ